MSNKSAFLAVLGFLVAAVVLGAFPQTGEDLFQKALRLETNEGKWLEAITLYQAILKQSPEDRQLAAEAQFRIGLCFERLGNEKAQNAYQAVIQDYGEQKDVVAKAKDRLSKLARPSEKPEEPEGIRIKQVWKKPYTDSLGSISPDGRLLAYVHWGEGDLAIHDLTSGENQILTHEADTAKGFAMEPTFSKNGKQIAYSWWNPYHTYDLLLVDVKDPKPRRLYRQEGEHVYPATWVSDDELIFTRSNFETKLSQVCSLSISSGTIRVLKTFDRGRWGQLSGSPDGRFIAYAFGNEADKGNSDINLFEMHGSGEIPLVKHPAKDMPLGWVPGRKEFLFTSDRSGTWDLWAIPVDKGKPSGPVERIYTNVGQVQPVGFAQNGDCFIGFSRRNFSAIIAPFNAETGELDEKSGKSLLGSNWLATWSPDGRYLAYGGDDRQVHIRDLKTGEERVLTEILINAVYPCWSPDGNSILMVGIDKDKFRTQGYKGGVYAVDVKTSRITEILLLSDYQYNTPDDDAFPLSDVQWSLDGKSIFYLFFKDRLVKHDLATGEDTILYKHPNFERDVMKRSPDGKKLFFATRPPEGKKSRLFTIPVEGGKEKELCTAQEADIFGIGMWSPDGIYIYFTEVKDGGTSLWRIPAEGGTPQKVWQSKNRAVILGIHPDGTQMAFTINERELEIRVIENLVEELDKVFKASK